MEVKSARICQIHRDCAISPERDSRGFETVVLPRHTLLFRGTGTHEAKSYLLPPDRPAFFGGPQVALAYSNWMEQDKGCQVYILTDDVRLLDMSNKHNLLILLRNLPPEEANVFSIYSGYGRRSLSLRDAYALMCGGYKDKPLGEVRICSSGYMTPEAKRNDDYISMQVARSVAKLGFDGWIIGDNYKRDVETFLPLQSTNVPFHPEVMLVAPLKHTRLISPDKRGKCSTYLELGSKTSTEKEEEEEELTTKEEEELLKYSKLAKPYFSEVRYFKIAEDEKQCGADWFPYFSETYLPGFAISSMEDKDRWRCFVLSNPDLGKELNKYPDLVISKLDREMIRELNKEYLARPTPEEIKYLDSLKGVTCANKYSESLEKNRTSPGITVRLPSSSSSSSSSSSASTSSSSDTSDTYCFPLKGQKLADFMSDIEKIASLSEIELVWLEDWYNHLSGRKDIVPPPADAYDD